LDEIVRLLEAKDKAAPMTPRTRSSDTSRYVDEDIDWLSEVEAKRGD
jgi:hypothetical protein